MTNSSKRRRKKPERNTEERQCRDSGSPSQSVSLSLWGLKFQGPGGAIDGVLRTYLWCKVAVMIILIVGICLIPQETLGVTFAASSTKMIAATIKGFLGKE